MATALAIAALPMSRIASAQSLPLLDQSTIRSPLSAGCAGQPDSTPVVVDPRTLVTASVNANSSAAIQFNAFFVDLHNPPAPYVNRLPPRPQTCGDFRASIARGQSNLQSRQYFQPLAFTLTYNDLYKVWYPLTGLDLLNPLKVACYATAGCTTYQPADFDLQVQQRYGLFPAPFSNPYPKSTDTASQKANGGSGQLPIGLVQGKDDFGNWTGMIGASCSACHDSRLGSTSEAGFSWGHSNSANDSGLLASDLLRSNPLTWVGELLPVPWSTGRGSSDAIGLVTLLPALFDMDNLTFAPSLLEYKADTPAAGMTKAPAWWVRAFKTRQFWDGALSSDNVHSEMAFGVANLARSAQQRRNLETEFEDINNFLISLSPPPYPQTINTTLAQQGAVIFHERDLWAGGANASIPKQPGNGSCASCHGVYSPRYAADTNYLPDPRLKGVAGVVTPIATIQTDPQRMQLMASDFQRRAWASSWWAYNELSPDWYTYNDLGGDYIFNFGSQITQIVATIFLSTPNVVSSELRRVGRGLYDAALGPLTSPIGPNQWVQPIGYVAPPLYGAWANAPFLHNGSVPNLWGVLKPSDRPAAWQRPYTAAGTGGKNKGYDYSYASYDFQKLGWKYTALNCSVSLCQGDSVPDEMIGDISSLLAPSFNLALQTPPPITDQQIAARMTYNSSLYGNGNGGHAFTQSLTDSERLALIEYLKTL